jgi:hypothetical protein
MSVLTALLLGSAVAGAQTPDVPVAPVSAPTPATPPASDSKQPGYHDLICKPNGTEDGFDCADEATPAKIVPIPWQVVGPRPQDLPITG